MPRVLPITIRVGMRAGRSSPYVEERSGRADHAAEAADRQADRRRERLVELHVLGAMSRPARAGG